MGLSHSNIINWSGGCALVTGQTINSHVLYKEELNFTVDRAFLFFYFIYLLFGFSRQDYSYLCVFNVAQIKLKFWETWLVSFG